MKTNSLNWMVLLIVITSFSTSCRKHKGEGGSSAPQLSLLKSPINEGFKNTKDLSGFRQKAGEASSMLSDKPALLPGAKKSSNVRSLNSFHQFIENKIDPKYRTKMTNILSLVENKLADNPSDQFGSFPDIEQEIPEIPEGFEDNQTEENDDDTYSPSPRRPYATGFSSYSAIFDDAVEGSDCGSMIEDLEADYETIEKTMKSSLATLAQTDLSNNSRFKAVAKNDEKEAFAYEITIDSKQLKDLSAPDIDDQGLSDDLEDGSVTMRFGGGANDEVLVVSLSSNANAKVKTDDTPIFGNFRNLFEASVNTKSKSFSLGTVARADANTTVENKPAKFDGELKIQLDLVAGERPSIGIESNGFFNANDPANNNEEIKENFSLKINLVKISEKQLNLNYEIKSKNDSHSENIKLNVDTLGRCKVAQ